MDKVEPYLKKGSRKDPQLIVERFGNREHLTGVGVYNSLGQSIAITPGLAVRLTAEPVVVRQAATNGQSAGEYIRVGEASAYVYAVPLHQDEAVVGILAIVQDASYINAQSRRIWRETFLRVLMLVFLITLTTLLIVRWSITGPVARAAQWMRALRMGTPCSRPAAADLDMFRPLANEMATFAASLTAARSAATQEAQLRQAAHTFWTAERLSVHVRGKLGKSRLFVVANREPYVHKHRAKGVEAIVPASGLVTALEPVLRACDGTWVAHGSGDADREPVDKHDRLRVPPDDPRNTLRRVWLSKEEERILLRFLQRRSLAALPYRSCAPCVSGLRLAAL